MPLPTFLMLALAVGIASALAASRELRFTPRHALATDGFRALAAFVGFVLLPATGYFYAFHGDWFLLYVVDAGGIPSAFVLLGVAFECLLAFVGFVCGAALSRAQRVGIGAALVAACVAVAVAVPLVWRDRLSVVGTYSQYRGDYGLEPIGGALLQGMLVFGGFVLFGAAYLVARIRYAQRRSGS